jgi:hypothetical protein
MSEVPIHNARSPQSTPRDCVPLSPRGVSSDLRLPQSSVSVGAGDTFGPAMVS